MGKRANIKGLCWVAVVAVVAIALQLTVGNFPVDVFRFPINILSAALWLALLSIVYRQRATSSLSRFMLSPSATWLSFAVAACVSIYLGLERNPSSDSWPVVVALLFILSHLALIILRGWRNSGGIRWRFTILHLGLLIALGSGFWGTPDREQIRIAVDSHPSNEAYYTDGTPHFLSYTLRLADYDIEYATNGTPEHYMAEVAIDDNIATISVNHPYALTWSEKLYLISFGQKTAGATYCIVEIVREPWQWLTTTGITMLIVGAIMMFVSGPRRNTNELKTERV